MKRKILSLSALACSYMLIGGVGVSHAVWDTSAISTSSSEDTTYTAIEDTTDLDTSVYTNDQLTALVQTASPNNSGAGSSIAAGNAVAGANSGATAGRMASLRAEKTYAQMGNSPVGPAGSTSSGNVLQNPGQWGVVVGTWGDQDDIKGEKGFEYDTYGFMFGYDHKMSNAWLIGVNAGYANSDVDSGENTNTDIDTYNIGIYSSYSFDQIYIDYGVMYSYNDGDSDRTIIDIDRRIKASGDPDSDAYTFYIQMGYEIPYDNMIITPLIGLMHSSVNSDGYTESDQDTGFGLTVADSDDDFFSSTLGVKGEYFMSEELHLKGRVKWTHEFSDDLQHTTSARFNAGSNFFPTDGIDLDQNRFNVGIGVKYNLSDKMTLDADYDYDWADEFDSHTGRIGIKYYF